MLMPVALTSVALRHFGVYTLPSGARLDRTEARPSTARGRRVEACAMSPWPSAPSAGPTPLAPAP